MISDIFGFPAVPDEGYFEAPKHIARALDQRERNRGTEGNGKVDPRVLQSLEDELPCGDLAVVSFTKQVENSSGQATWCLRKVCARSSALDVVKTALTRLCCSAHLLTLGSIVHHCRRVVGEWIAGNSTHLVFQAGKCVPCSYAYSSTIAGRQPALARLYVSARRLLVPLTKCGAQANAYVAVAGLPGFIC